MTQPHDAAPDAATVADTIRLLLHTQVQCVLATVSPAGPAQHLMAYAFDDDLHQVYVASLRATEKVSNMLRNPATSLFWDNRTGNTRDHIEGLALMATGRARVLDHAKRAAPAAALQQRNTSLGGLLGHADAVVLAIHISSYRLVQGYTSITHYDPTAQAVTDPSIRRN
jgi:nitroimidazol reductase NimA-like FMN-containing flavoprotein (pyridoxamine 5'-phosphate oxidase superfamily)